VGWVELEELSFLWLYRESVQGLPNLHLEFGLDFIPQFVSDCTGDPKEP